MKYLRNFIKICARHSENDCQGCPFDYKKTHSDCHKFILKYPEEARQMINQYVLEALEPLGKMDNGKYREKCEDCGITVIIDKNKISYDSYLECDSYKCPNCKTIQKAVI